MNIEHENVYTRLFAQLLEGNVWIWFRKILAHSINSWAEVVNISKNQWGIKKDVVYYIT